MACFIFTAASLLLYSMLPLKSPGSCLPYNRFLKPTMNSKRLRTSIQHPSARRPLLGLPLVILPLNCDTSHYSALNFNCLLPAQPYACPCLLEVHHCPPCNSQQLQGLFPLQLQILCNLHPRPSHSFILRDAMASVPSSGELHCALSPFPRNDLLFLGTFQFFNHTVAVRFVSWPSILKIGTLSNAFLKSIYTSSTSPPSSAPLHYSVRKLYCWFDNNLTLPFHKSIL